jgi:hypothetical protein
VAGLYAETGIITREIFSYPEIASNEEVTPYYRWVKRKGAEKRTFLPGRS